MATTPDLGIPYIAGGQAQPEVTHNDALNLLQVLSTGVLSRGLNAPPGAPAQGDAYIIGTAPTGAWAGRANKIAGWFGTAWIFMPDRDNNGTNIAIGARHEGLKVWVRDVDQLVNWTGSAWAVIAATVLPIASGGTGQATAVAAIDALHVKGADIASAATTNLAAATGDFVDVTGNVAITALGTAPAGVRREVRFTGTPTLTHNAASLTLPTNANIVVAAGDRAVFRSLGGGSWICMSYHRASGAALA